MNEEYGVSHMPDVLNCLADLSNDEVFTPPDVANAMLDLLPEDIWQRDDVRFLDPCCKTGVFLREITKRLLRGQLPDFDHRLIEIEEKRCKHEKLNGREEGYLTLLQATLDHILKEQVYGIAITELTALMTRRTLYCAKYADSEFSVVHFDNPDGNIRYVPMDHEWEGKSGNERCKWCGTSRKEIENRTSDETHAYEFIHTTTRPERLFNVEAFDIICGNPPYNLRDGGAAASAMPLYHFFVEQALKLDPQYITMIIPARWYSGGKGLDGFRAAMLHDEHIKELHDFADPNECFPGVSIKGGVCYFLRDNSYEDNGCKIVNHANNTVISTLTRPLLENGNDIFIRWNKAVDILKKVQQIEGKSFSNIVSARKPFGLDTKFRGKKTGAIKLWQNKSFAYVESADLVRGLEALPKWKVFISEAYGAGEDFPHQIINKPFKGKPNEACTETYLMIGPVNTEQEADSIISYIQTKFFRFLVLLHKPSQHATAKVYSFVPLQDWSRLWTDADLYKKYGLKQDEIDFIESMIRPMELGGDND